MNSNRRKKAAELKVANPSLTSKEVYIVVKSLNIKGKRKTDPSACADGNNK